jgi:type IX secretion system PorP/SprF family membrane protein
MKRITFILLTSLSWQFAEAQDPHFSQFFASPLTLNPAYTGKFDGILRVAGNYRNQWPTINNAFTTATVSLDFPILQSSLPEMDTWGVGIMALTDQSGNKIMRNNFIGISTAYHKSLDEDGFNEIALGFQGTYATKRLDISKAQFADQVTDLGFTNVSQDIFGQGNTNVAYFDFNVGLMYTTTTNGENSIYGGVSYYHISSPKESFRGADFYLPSRLTIHAGGMFPLDETKSLHGSVLFQKQAAASETVLGGAFSIDVSQDETEPIQIYAGAWYRVKDAFIPYFGLEFKNLWIGATYDINHSALRNASQSRGGNEISLIYVQQPVEKRNRQTLCPRF